MADREKIIKEKLDEIVELTRGLNYVSFMIAVENANDIIALVKEQEKENSKINNSYLKLLHVASKQPRIVRCKDCRFYTEPDSHGDRCDRIHWSRGDDWFCADGKRRDAE